MSKRLKKPSRPFTSSTNPITGKFRPVASAQVPINKQQQFVELQNSGREAASLDLARELVRDYPKGTFGWKALGASLLRNQHLEEAENVLQKALFLTTKDPEIYYNLGCVMVQQGRTEDAMQQMEHALALKPDFEPALMWLVKTMQDKSLHNDAQRHLDRVLELQPDNPIWVKKKAASLMKQGRFNEGGLILEKLLETYPDNPEIYNGLGNAYYNLGRFDEGEEALSKCRELSPENFLFYSDRLLLMHYNPDLSIEEIQAAHLEWNDRFAPKIINRAHAADRNPNRRIRVGMISAGFRIHPVGQMIASALLFLPREDIEIYAYTMNEKVDAYTKVIQQRADHWESIIRLTNNELDEKIRSDGIDILLDLSGHTEGSRSAVIAMEPAPLQVKWVGGQINTTGLKAMDYMISDSVETPPGIDATYVEKLIRLPDDYICYVPRADTPDIGPVPARKNGYITFGCFNNPAKINNVIIAHWAELMSQVADSRLFLKGSQYDSEDMVERICQQFESLGIARERLIIEQRSAQVELLDCYNRVDIALDPWPYSGGLTTCEALLMGVPVVTLPGPTFAGRHSATHLTNAGLPELVVESWEQYLAKAMQLANDLEDLESKRKTLRSQLQQSPVCDAHRFARHLNTALRAIWQRYCEDKAPAALTFNKDGQAHFEGDDEPVSVTINELENPRDNVVSSQETAFDWALPRQIVVMDNGGNLLRDKHFPQLQKSNAFAIIAFDPARRLTDTSSFDADDNVQIFPHVLLGNGDECTLYACLSGAMSSTLKPLPGEQLPSSMRPGATVLANLPIHSLALDAIEGLEQVDWLILDECCKPLEVLCHGRQTLANTLILQVRVLMQPRYEQQASIGDVMDWARTNGFALYRMNNTRHIQPLSQTIGTLAPTQLESTDLLFIPSKERMDSLGEDQRRILAYLLHTVFNIQDLTLKVLSQLDPAVADAYLATLTVNPEEQPGRTDVAAERKRRQATESAQRPAAEREMTLPDAPHMSDAERNLFRKSLKAAKCYFEFGCGGSTVWAVREGLVVKGVESDARWVNALRDKLGPDCQVEAVDIGQTGKWGMPVGNDSAERFPDYSQAIDKHTTAFDLILVDGRFRVACTLKAILHILEHSDEPQNARVFLHDFWNRPQYHAVLEFLEEIERVDTAGLFKVKAGIDAAEVASTWKEYACVPQ